VSELHPVGITDECRCNSPQETCSCECHLPGNDWCWAMVGICLAEEMRIYQAASEVLRLRRLAEVGSA
jgi:hypothetical protein